MVLCGNTAMFDSFVADCFVAFISVAGALTIARLLACLDVDPPVLGSDIVEAVMGLIEVW